MSAIYFDHNGWARYVEDVRTGPQPPEVVAGLERHPVDIDRVWPIDIVQAEREFKGSERS